MKKYFFSLIIFLSFVFFFTGHISKAYAVSFLSEVHDDDAGMISANIPITLGSGNTVVVIISEILGTVTSVTDTGGSVYTKLASKNDPNDTRQSVEIWGTLSSSVASSVTVNFSNTVNAGISVLRYSGVTVFGNTNTSNGVGNSSRAVSVTTQDSGNWVVAGFSEGASLPACSATSGAFRAICFNNNQGSITMSVGENTSASAGSVITSYTSNFSTNWTGAVVELRSSGGTPPLSDITPPTTPTSLSATAISSSAINLSWTASIDAVGVTGYKIYRNGTLLATSNSTASNYLDSGLSASTAYSYTVQSYDAAGNNSSQSSSASVTTQAGQVVDTIAPSVPTNLSATAVSSSQINLSWTASTDAVGVTGYRVYRGGTQVGTSATNSYSDSGLSASTNYSYTVSAYDLAGNNSTQSSSASATTQTVVVGARTFYIDYVSGSDSNNGTTKASPWKRAPGMTGCTGVCASTTLAGGDTVIFKGGTTWTASYPWNLKGGTSSRVTYTTDNTWYSGALYTQPTFDRQAGGQLAVGASYLTLNDLRFINCGTPQVANSIKCLQFDNTREVTITNSTFVTESWIGIYFVFTDGVSHSNFVWTGNDFSKTSGAIWFASAAANTTMHNITYNNNTFHDYSSQIGGGVHGDGAWHSFNVPDNDSTQYIDNLTFCNNRFYGDFRNSFAGGGAMTGFFFSEDGLSSATICNNDMSFSPVQASMFDGLIVLSANGHARSGLGGIGIYNNSLANIGANAMSAGIHSSGGFNNVTVKNNILSGMQYPVFVEDGSSSFVSDYNIYNGSSGYLVFGSSFQSYSQWQASGRDIHGKLGVDPSWVSSPGNEHLNSSSPAINAGVNLSGLGISILNFDKDNISRGSTWDIGAYQFSSGGTPPSSTPIPGDLNLDHTVNSTDSSLLSSKWNQNYSVYDLNSDGIINSLDFAVLKSNWGKTW